MSHAERSERAGAGGDPGGGAMLYDVPRRPQRREALNLEPGCVYGVVTRERVDELTAELREIKARLNQLFTLVIGGIAVDVLLRISGLG